MIRATRNAALVGVATTLFVWLGASGALAARPDPNTGKAPAGWTLRARAAYEGEWILCSEPWRYLVEDAGIHRKLAYSRTNLRYVAAKLEYGPNGFGAPYNDIATRGCMDGFLHFLKTRPRQALR
jgi:hypothetical protein